MPRKKPFSAKQKKEQLKKKRQLAEKHQGSRHNHGSVQSTSLENLTDSDADSESSSHSLTVLTSQTSGNKPYRQTHLTLVGKGRKPHDPDRYKLSFETENNAEIEARKKQAQQPVVRFSKADLEVSLEDIYKPGSVLDMPKRPEWSYKMDKREVEANEEHMFRRYIQDIKNKHDHLKLSYFEMNIETWRQLWRVLEVSNIVVIITDVRYPVIHFSPTLYDYAHKDLKKEVILVLNKIDLIPPEVVVAWKDYFQTKFPELNIICFTSFPKDPDEIKKLEFKVKKRLMRRKKTSFIPVGPRQLHHVCDKLMKGTVNLRDWLLHIEEQENYTKGGVSYEEELSTDEEEDDDSMFHDVETREGILTIGLVGHPNVGKSSLLNGLIGKKVVSCSRTPGHTKHFQTIFLTPSVRLCDSPGLVFPSLVDRRLQILSGTYPIAQVREPYSVVGYLASCVPLEKLLGLSHPKILQSEDSNICGDDLEWSAWNICDAWAEQRGYYTAKAGRPDTYRAANSLLRLATEGKIVICLYPPGFTSKAEFWISHPETKEIAKLQQQFSDLKQWRLEEEEAIARNETSDHNNNGSESNDQEDQELQVSNAFSLLSQDD